MDERSTYTDCELTCIRDEGYDSSWAAEICADAEGRPKVFSKFPTPVEIIL